MSLAPAVLVQVLAAPLLPLAREDRVPSGLLRLQQAVVGLGSHPLQSTTQRVRYGPEVLPASSLAVHPTLLMLSVRLVPVPVLVPAPEVGQRQ